MIIFVCELFSQRKENNMCENDGVLLFLLCRNNLSFKTENEMKFGTVKFYVSFTNNSPILNRQIY